MRAITFIVLSALAGCSQPKAKTDSAQLPPPKKVSTDSGLKALVLRNLKGAVLRGIPDTREYAGQFAGGQQIKLVLTASQTVVHFGFVSIQGAGDLGEGDLHGYWDEAKNGRVPLHWKMLGSNEKRDLMPDISLVAVEGKLALESKRWGKAELQPTPD